MSRPLIIAAAACVGVMLAAGAAEAGNNRQQLLQPAQYGAYLPQYRLYVPPTRGFLSYGPTVRLYLYADPWTAYYGSDPHSEAVRRIMAEHSRNRWYTHPRSLYNSPPPRFGWGGWIPGY